MYCITNGGYLTNSPFPEGVALSDRDYEFPDKLYNIVKNGYIKQSNIEHLLGHCIACNSLITRKQRYHIYAQSRSLKFLDYPKYICEFCIKKFHICDFCGEIYDSKILTNGLCSSCLNKSLKRYVNNYTFRAEEEIPIIGEKDYSAKDGIFYGIELEYESKDLHCDTMFVYNLIKNFAILKRDSSIERGFEIVSAPCSITRHFNLWNDFFDKLPATVQVYRTCGMHVHASRSRLTNLQIGKMLVFLHSPENHKFIETIAERKSNTQNDYEILKKYSDGKNGGINLPQNADRHTALNLNNYKTIEFRIFNSPKNKLTLIKNIEFCKALIKFTGMGEHSINQAKDYRVFSSYIKTFKKEYAYLAKFLKEKSYL